MQTKPPTAPRTGIGALALALALILAACSSSGTDDTEAAGDDPLVKVKVLPPEGGDPALNGGVPTGPPNIGDLTLPEVTAEGVVGDFPLRASEDGFLVLFFGYAHCPDVCPLTTSTLRNAYGLLDSEDAERVTVAFSTLDPARDTAEDIARYVRAFSPGFRSLRSDDPVVTGPVHEALGVVAIQQPGEDPEQYTIDHTATVFVVDDTGGVVLQWPFGMDAASIASDLDVMLDRIDDQG